MIPGYPMNATRYQYSRGDYFQIVVPKGTVPLGWAGTSLSPKEEVEFEVLL